MIDIKVIRENPELVKENMKKKFRTDLKLVDELIKLDEDWKKAKFEEEQIRKDRNVISKKISELKKAGKDADKELKKAKELPTKLEKLEANRKKLEEKITEIRIKIPNIMSDKVPLGKDDSENVEEKVFWKN